MTDEPKKKMSLLKKILIGIGILFVFTAIAGKGKDGERASGRSQSSASTSSTNSPPTAVAAASKAYGVGDIVSLDDSTWVVLESKDLGKTLKTNNQFVEPLRTEGKYISVSFKVTNTTNKEERIAIHPPIVDSKGREFGELDMQSMYAPKGMKTMSLEQLPSSMPRKFWAVYEVPPDATGLKFKARELSTFGEKVFIGLGL